LPSLPFIIFIQHQPDKHRHFPSIIRHSIHASSAPVNPKVGGTPPFSAGDDHPAGATPQVLSLRL
jgi:hypothetical protein